MSTTIAKAFARTLTIDGTAPCIAQLAQHVEFDPSLARRFDTSPACVAVDALRDLYASHEMVDFEADYHDGGRMTFRDGSKIAFH